VAWKTASNGGSEVRAAVAEQEPDVREPLAEGKSEVAGLLDCPLPGGMFGDAAEVHPAGAMLNEHQDIQSLQQHGVHVQKVDREDPGGLDCQELPPRQARASRRRIDARGMQDLPHGGRCDRHAELRQLAVDPAVSPQRILLRQPNDQADDARDCWRTAGLTPSARVVLSPRQFAVPGQQRRGRNREDFGPAPTGDEPRQRGEPHPVCWLVPDPAGAAAQDRVLVPEHQQFSILRKIFTEYQDG
jgi:hypothetical protein